MINQRLKRGIGTSIILGLLCVLGVIFRMGYQGRLIFLLALFYNRLLMGIVISLASNRKGILVILRGAVLGFLVSLAFFLSTGFQDPVSLFAGIIYGIIIDTVASKYTNVFIEMVKNLVNNLRSKEDIR